MLAELGRDGTLYQEVAASEIEKRFGQDFTPTNENGNLSIRRDVLAAFRKLTDETVVWERDERMWRKREGFDSPGRQQD
jgi:predicted phage-related endonuclease